MTSTEMKTRLEHGANQWASKLTKQQKEVIRDTGADNVTAYRALRKYDISKLTMKEIYAIVRISAMGII